MSPSAQEPEQVSLGLPLAKSPDFKGRFYLGNDMTWEYSETKSQNINMPSATSLPPASPPSSGSSIVGQGESDIENVNFNHWNSNKEKVVTSPYDYIAAYPGKEMRTMLLACFNEFLEVPKESVDIIANAVRMLHTASLLVDDIQDGSDLRRGRPSAHKVFGDALTINSGNYMYFMAMQELNKLNNPHAHDIFVEEMLYLHRGQAMDLYWRDTLTCPTEEDYFEMISNKTGGLFRLAYKLMKAESSVDVDLIPVVELLGVLFQVADDYKNLCSKEYGDLKGVGEDLTEGKFSFPVIHSIRSDPTDSKLIHILQQRPTEESIKRFAIEIMEQSGSLAYTKQVIEKLTAQAYKAIEQVDQGRGRGKPIHKLIEKITKS